VSTQNLKLIDRLVEPNFTYERGFQLCFWQFQRPKKFSHSLRSQQTFSATYLSAVCQKRKLPTFLCLNKKGAGQIYSAKILLF